MTAAATLLRSCVALALFCASSAAAQQTSPVPAVDLAAVKKDLISMRTLQEVHYTNAGTYSVNQTTLEFVATNGVTIKVLEASDKGWAGVGTLTDVAGVSCVIKVGTVSKLPKTERGATPEKEGIVVCDGTADRKNGDRDR